jgi:hypothetical protein
VPLLDDGGALPERALVISAVCGDLLPDDRCGQDEQHCVDHDPVRNHLASPLTVTQRLDAAPDAGCDERHMNVDGRQTCFTSDRTPLVGGLAARTGAGHTGRHGI